jgi:hypothetical protein
MTGVIDDLDRAARWLSPSGLRAYMHLKATMTDTGVEGAELEEVLRGFIWEQGEADSRSGFTR